MLTALPFGMVYVMPLTLLVGLWLGGPWSFFTVIYIFGIMPVLDAAAGLRTENPDTSRHAWLFDAWLYVWSPVQIALMVAVIATIASGTRTPLESIGLILSLGVVAGAGGINIAHELMHRTSAVARGTAELLMTVVTYPHFCVEHVLGHHRTVATPEDPASARRGEVIYTFLFRTVFGGLMSAWHLESRRVEKRSLPLWADRRIRHPILVIALYAAVAVAFGWVGVAVLFAQSVVAVVLLEVINYVEHYGLSREKIDDRYERVQPKHSWNSAHRFTGWYLFNLPRHADHHYEARRPYRELRHLADSPQLPVGYPTMVLIALVPPLFFYIMNRRVDAWNASIRASPSTSTAHHQPAVA